MGVERRKNRDGTTSYRVRWREGGGRTEGPYRARAFTREDEAVRFRARLIAHDWRDPDVELEPTAATPAAEETPTVEEWARRHAASITGVGAGYRAQVLRDVDRHVAGAELGRTSLGEVTTELARLWVRGLEAGTHPWLLVENVDATGAITTRPGPLAPATVRRLKVQLSAALADAVEAGLILRNPLAGVRVHRRDQELAEVHTYLTHEEWALVASALPAGTYRDLATVLVATGLRFGEATALEERHVDLLARPFPTLRVDQAWQDDGEGGYRLGPPKSARSRRTVELDEAAVEALLPHLDHRGGFLFRSPRGALIRHNNWRNRVWLPALAKAAKAGLEKTPRTHDLRHTHASWLIAAGLPVAAISRRLGHESINTTVDRYGHILPSTQADAVAAISAALRPRTATQD